MRSNRSAISGLTPIEAKPAPRSAVAPCTPLESTLRADDPRRTFGQEHRPAGRHARRRPVARPGDRRPRRRHAGEFPATDRLRGPAGPGARRRAAVTRHGGGRPGVPAHGPGHGGGGRGRRAAWRRDGQAGVDDGARNGAARHLRLCARLSNHADRDRVRCDRVDAVLGGAAVRNPVQRREILAADDAGGACGQPRCKALWTSGL